MKLNLGCGKDIKEGYVNLDVVDYGGNQIHDLNKFFFFEYGTTNYHESFIRVYSWFKKPNKKMIQDYFLVFF